LDCIIPSLTYVFMDLYTGILLDQFLSTFVTLIVILPVCSCYLWLYLVYKNYQCITYLSQDVKIWDVLSTLSKSGFISSSGRFLNRRIAAAYSKGVHFEPLRDDKRGETIVAQGTDGREIEQWTTERGERVQRHGMVVARKAGNYDTTTTTTTTTTATSTTWMAKRWRPPMEPRNELGRARGRLW